MMKPKRFTQGNILLGQVKSCIGNKCNSANVALTDPVQDNFT